MPYEIDILRTPDKFLTKLATAQHGDAEAIEDALDELAEDPRRTGAIALKGVTGVWRYRVGNYRICYRIDDGQLVILVITISTRDEVYEILRRALGRR